MLPDDAREALVALGIQVFFDEPMGARCSFGVGGPADVYAPDPSEADASALIAWAKAAKLPVTRWSGLDNLLVSDAGIKGLVLGPHAVEAGSTRRMFAEPVRGPSVDLLVERAGMRGVRVRGARICPDDGNAVRNDGGATAQDVRLLMDSVRRRVARDWGLQLVDALRLIGRRRPGR